jgi:hypothetical protein
MTDEGHGGIGIERDEARAVGGVATSADTGGVPSVEADRTRKRRIAHDRVDGVVPTGTVARLALHTRQPLFGGRGVAGGTPRIAPLLGRQAIEGSGVGRLPPLFVCLGVARPAAKRAHEIAGDGLGHGDGAEPQCQCGARGAVARGSCSRF